MPAPTLQTLLSLRQEVLLLLAQDANTRFQDIKTGTGDAVSQDTSISLNIHLNRALSALAMYAVPRRASAVLTFPAGADVLALNQAVTPDGGQMIYVDTLLIGGVEMRLSQDYHRIYGLTAMQGAPQVWYWDGQEALGLAPYPAAATACTVKGFSTPPPLVLDTDVADWLDASMTEAVVAYAAARVSQSRQDNNVISSSAEIWQKKYEEILSQQKQLLVSRNPSLAKFAFGLLPETGNR